MKHGTHPGPQAGWFLPLPWPWAAALGVLLMLAAVDAMAQVRQYHPQGFPVPTLFGAKRYGDQMIDFDPNRPGKETRVEKFATEKGGRVFRFSHDGHIFSYEADRDQLEPMDYEIVDMDGDGVFETRCSPYDEYPLPPWTYQ